MQTTIRTQSNLHSHAITDIFPLLLLLLLVLVLAVLLARSRPALPAPPGLHADSASHCFKLCNNRGRRASARADVGPKFIARALAAANTSVRNVQAKCTGTSCADASPGLRGAAGATDICHGAHKIPKPATAPPCALKSGGMPNAVW